MHLSDTWNEEDTAEQAQFVDELARHLPGVRPAISLIPDHLRQQHREKIGVFCEA